MHDLMIWQIGRLRIKSKKKIDEIKLMIFKKCIYFYFQ